MQGKYSDEVMYRQRMMKYAQTHRVTETANRYHCSRKTVYKWLRRWDGTPESLGNRSRRPKRTRQRISEETLRKIRKRMKQCRWRDVLRAYQLSKERDGYEGSYWAFKALARRLREEKPQKKPRRRKPKPYQRAAFPGEKVQIDVKFVPTQCVVNGRKYYQFTAVDECTRWTFREMYDEHSTYSARDFLVKLIRRSQLPIREVQTDNGTEFTNALLVVKAQHKTLFEQALLDIGIAYHRIRIATPRHNGKVERQHRTDTERFYSQLRMFSLEDGRRQLAVYQRESNDHIKTCLGFRSPNEVLTDYLAVM